MNTPSFPIRAAAVRRVRGLAAPSLVAGLTLVAGLSTASAQGTAAAKVSGKEYVLAKTSSFNAPPAEARNPFWPIGWTPGPALGTVAVAPVYTVKAEDFVLTTTSVDYPPLAIINRRSYSVGDSIPVAGGADTVRVKAIQDGVVLLDHHGREIRVASNTSLAPAKK